MVFTGIAGLQVAFSGGVSSSGHGGMCKHATEKHSKCNGSCYYLMCEISHTQVANIDFPFHKISLVKR